MEISEADKDTYSRSQRQAPRRGSSSIYSLLPFPEPVNMGLVLLLDCDDDANSRERGGTVIGREEQI